MSDSVVPVRLFENRRLFSITDTIFISNFLSFPVDNVNKLVYINYVIEHKSIISYDV